MGKCVSKTPTGQVAICFMCLLPMCWILDKNSGYSSESDVLHYIQCWFPRFNGVERKINTQAAIILLFLTLSYFSLDEHCAVSITFYKGRNGLCLCCPVQLTVTCSYWAPEMGLVMMQELNFSFYFILIKCNCTSSQWLLNTTLDSRTW